MTKNGYHHGDLRGALVRAAIEFLDKGEPDQLSVRQLAKSLGVSEAAPYHHFPDRRSLELAVMAEGYVILRDRSRDAGRKSLADLLAVYVDFAVEHPNLFRLIHHSGEMRDPANTELFTLSEQAFEPLRGHVRHRLAAHGVDDPQRVEFLAMMVWTQVHGLADLVVSDFVRINNRDADFCGRAYAYMEAALDMTVAAET